MPVKICPDCGGKVSDTRNDCPHCGYLFKSTVTCPDCLEEIEVSNKCCPVCGRKNSDYDNSHKFNFYESKNNNILVTVAYIIAIIETVISGVSIIPLFWMIPMIQKIKQFKDGKINLSNEFIVCSILFLNVFTGILLLINDNSSKKNKLDSTCINFAYILAIISTVISGFMLIPLCWMIPMTIKLGKYKRGECSLSKGYIICSIIFLNAVSGILLLIQNKNKEYDEYVVNSSSIKIAHTFAILGTIVSGFALIPLLWTIPMTRRINDYRKGQKSLTKGFAICSILFLNIVSGILLLVHYKDKYPVENKHERKNKTYAIPLIVTYFFCMIMPLVQVISRQHPFVSVPLFIIGILSLIFRIVLPTLKNEHKNDINIFVVTLIMVSTVLSLFVSNLLINIYSILIISNLALIIYYILFAVFSVLNIISQVKYLKMKYDFNAKAFYLYLFPIIIFVYSFVVSCIYM